MARVEPRLDSPVGPKAAAVLHVHTYTSSPPLRVTVERAEEKLRRRLEPGVGKPQKTHLGALRVQPLRSGSWLWDLHLSPAASQLLTSSWCWWRLGNLTAQHSTAAPGPGPTQQ